LAERTAKTGDPVATPAAAAAQEEVKHPETAGQGGFGGGNGISPATAPCGGNGGFGGVAAEAALAAAAAGLAQVAQSLTTSESWSSRIALSAATP